MVRLLALALAGAGLIGCGPSDDAQTPAPVAATPIETPATPTAPPALSWEAVQDRYRQMETAPTDPLEALEHRAVVCAHLSGEIGSEDPEREAFLNAQIETYRCEPLVAEIRAMRDARASDPAAQRRLDVLLANLG
jgi:hypothetical protein